MRNAVFDDLCSLLHLALGFMVRWLSASQDAVDRAVALVLTVAFIAYQVIEEEGGLMKLGDLVEFITGYILGEIIL